MRRGIIFITLSSGLSDPESQALSPVYIRLPLKRYLPYRCLLFQDLRERLSQKKSLPLVHPPLIAITTPLFSLYSNDSLLTIFLQETISANCFVLYTQKIPFFVFSDYCHRFHSKTCTEIHFSIQQWCTIDPFTICLIYPTHLQQKPPQALTQDCGSFDFLKILSLLFD